MTELNEKSNPENLICGYKGPNADVLFGDSDDDFILLDWIWEGNISLAKLLTSGRMKLLESAKNKITEDKNDEYVPHLEITEVLLVHCNIVSNGYQQDLRDL